MSILCAVNDEEQNRNYLLGLIFGSAYRQRKLGRYWLWNLGKAISAESNYSMIVLQVCESHLKFTRLRDWFHIPTWLLGDLQLPRDAQANHKVSGDLRRIRRHELQGEITRDPQSFEDFYHNMHVPHARKRFGNTADIGAYKRLKRQFRHSELLLIKNREKSIAGQIILYDGRDAHFWDMGIRDGNPQYVKDGACCALSHFGLQHLQNQGYKHASLGYSRPFLHDGALQFKKKWSQRIVSGYADGFAINILSPTPAAEAFLCNNPFIYRAPRRLLCRRLPGWLRPALGRSSSRDRRRLFSCGVSPACSFTASGKRTLLCRARFRRCSQDASSCARPRT